jgi:hypothetical protein
MQTLKMNREAIAEEDFCAQIGFRELRDDAVFFLRIVNP